MAFRVGQVFVLVVALLAFGPTTALGDEGGEPNARACQGQVISALAMGGSFGMVAASGAISMSAFNAAIGQACGAGFTADQISGVLMALLSTSGDVAMLLPFLEDPVGTVIKGGGGTPP